MQEAQLAANVVKADVLQRVVVAFKAVVGCPMHAFWLTCVRVGNTSLPAQAFAQPVGLGHCPIANAFFLRGIAQPTTQAAGKVLL